MEKCEECGKKLGILEGYRHPTLGKDYQLCSPCFNQVSESVTKWGEFVRTNSFNNKSSDKNYNLEGRKIIQMFSKVWNKIENVNVEKKYIRR
jgi:hypothetical protein